MAGVPYYLIGGVQITDPIEQNIYSETLQLALDTVRRVAPSDQSAAMPQPLSRPYRIEDVPGASHNCFVTYCDVEPSGAGPLDGRTVGLKDNISLAGVPMTLGSPTMTDYVPSYDAAVVSRLLAGGARIVGKMRMDAFSFGSEGFGSGLDPTNRCENPVARGYLTGGSSSGSAVAVAAGHVDVALAGDQGGSIRVPASWCGVVGMKPTRGLVPNLGVVGIEPTIDCVGPIARSVRDCGLTLSVIATDPDGRFAGVDPSAHALTTDRHGLDGSGLRVGLLDEAFGHAGGDPAVDEAILAAAERVAATGASVDRLSIPEHRWGPDLAYVLQLLGSCFLFAVPRTLGQPDPTDLALASALDTAILSNPESLPPRAKLAMMLRERLGVDLDPLYESAITAAQGLRLCYDAALERVDALLMPTVPLLPAPFVEPRSRLDALRRALLRPGLEGVTANTSPFNATGHPALTVPVGLVKGLPVGAMVVGPHAGDSLVLRVGALLEATSVGL